MARDWHRWMLGSARHGLGKRLWVVLSPHTYSNETVYTGLDFFTLVLKPVQLACETSYLAFWPDSCSSLIPLIQLAPK